MKKISTGIVGPHMGADQEETKSRLSKATISRFNEALPQHGPGSMKSQSLAKSLQKSNKTGKSIRSVGKSQAAVSLKSRAQSMKSRVHEEQLKSIVPMDEPKDQEVPVDIDNVDPTIEVGLEE